MRKIEVSLSVAQWHGTVFIFDNNVGSLFSSETAQMDSKMPVTQGGKDLILSPLECVFQGFIFKNVYVNSEGKINPAYHIPVLSDPTYPDGTPEGSWKVISIN